MKQEILFRGKTDKGEWIIGSHYFDGKRTFIMRPFQDIVELVPETVGQLVHLDNGKTCFVVDKIKAYWRYDVGRRRPIFLEVTYLNGCFMAGTNTFHELYRFYQSDWEVAGNIHDKEEVLNQAS